jgi:RimJ/RimL family protein N-acetyltransferase
VHYCVSCARVNNYKATIKVSATIETARLLLRQWRADDSNPFAALNADADVMQFFPARLSELDSNAHMQRISAAIDERGWGLWAVELKATKEFAGFTGLNIPFFPDLPFYPCTEIGWRLARQFWGQGYATEAAQASLKFAFKNLGLEEVVAFTPVLNLRSSKVMQRLGMINTEQNFLHPAIPVGHNLREHLLYKITRAEWEQGHIA